MIIGIDGGGSKTQFLLCSLQGQKLGSRTLAGIHYHQAGFAAYQKTVAQGIADLCRQVSCSEKELRFVCIGTPGYGESAADSQQLEQLAAEILPCPHELLNDVKLAWAGALACRPGICILAGTGSMAWAVDEEGQDLRSGGWGEIFGDEGSAYWLGKESCRLFSKMADGRLAAGPLYHLMKEHLEIAADFDLIHCVYAMPQPRKDLAQLAVILYQASQAGDQAARELFSQAAGELAQLVEGILRQYRGQRPVLLSWNGGVFRAGALLTVELEKALQGSPVQMQAPSLEPAAGACLYSAEKLGLPRAPFLNSLLAS